MSLGDNLREKRKEIQLSQQEVADYLHISRQSVSKWETDLTCPDIDNLKLLATLYHTSIDDLLSDETPLSDEPSPKPTDSSPANHKDILIANVFICILLIFSCEIAPLGVILSLGVLFMGSRFYPSISTWCKLVAFVCFLISVNNSIVLFSAIFIDSGTGKVTPL